MSNDPQRGRQKRKTKEIVRFNKPTHNLTNHDFNAIFSQVLQRGYLHSYYLHKNDVLNTMIFNTGNIIDLTAIPTATILVSRKFKPASQPQFCYTAAGRKIRLSRN